MRSAWIFCCSILPPGAWPRLAEPGRLQAQAARAWREGRGLDLPPSRILSALSPFASAFAVAALEARPPEALGSGTVRRWEKIWLADLSADPDGIRGLLAGIEQEAQRDDRARRIPPEMLQAMAERIAIVPSGLLAAAAGTGERWRRPPRLTRMRVMWRRFNATTAFLLRLFSAQKPSQNHGFNATTAFLLREMSWEALYPVLRVSMPPRRSCFFFLPPDGL